MADSGSPSELHQVQLNTVGLERVTAGLRSAAGDDTLSVKIPKTILRTSNADRTDFTCSVRTVVSVPLGGRSWRADVTVRGTFSSDGGLTVRQLRFFVQTSALYVLWPFARTYVDQLATLSGVVAPPLPLIVRRPTPEDPLE